MGIFDKAKDALSDNADRADEGIDRAANFADDRTGNAHSAQIDPGADFTKDKLDDYASSGDAAPPAGPAATPAPPAGSAEPPD
jgi:MT0933-like antitoxin protein